MKISRDQVDVGAYLAAMPVSLLAYYLNSPFLVLFCFMLIYSHFARSSSDEN